MPSLNRLWRRLYLQNEHQKSDRVRVLYERSFLASKPHFSSYSQGGGGDSSLNISGQFHKFSKVGDPGKPLSIRQAASRAFATPSVHSPVWQSFSYYPCSALLEKNQAARPKPTLRWTLSTTNHRINCANAKFRIPTAKLHVLPSMKENPIPTFYSSQMQWTSNNTEFSPSYGNTPQLTLSLIGPTHSKPSWICRLRDADGDLFSYLDKMRRHEKLQLQHLISRSMEFHLIQLGPWLLPAMKDFISRSAYGFTCGAAAFMHLGLTFDCSAESEGTEARDKQGEGSLESKRLRLLSAACYLPHPDKEETGGEDAYFICTDKQVVGVADGVGGWADVGVDAGEYARQLMSQSLIAVQQEPAGFIDTAHIMQIAHSKTTCRGSSTACILALSENGLQATNLGDSGFLVVRNGRLVFKSPAQQHNFNVPYQLESGGGDPPSAAEVFSVDVAVGDIIVAGTDGLFDNLYDTEVVSIVVQATRSAATPDATARRIASLARERAADCNRQTPFATAAQDAGFRFYGGKMDDITVIVSYVVK